MPSPRPCNDHVIIINNIIIIIIIIIQCCSLPACGNTMNKGGNITSPHFPGHYPNDIHCKWLLEAPVNNTVVLKLEEFHLEQDKKCFYDYVEFYEGNTTNANFRINQRLCGQKHPMEIKSDGRWLLVVFQTDKTENKPGFRFSWKASKIGNVA